MSLNDERTVNYSIHCNFYRASVSGQKAKLQNAFRKPYSMNIPFNLQEFSSRSYPLMRIHIIGQSCNIQLRSNQCKVVLDGFFWNSNLFFFVDRSTFAIGSFYKILLGSVSFEMVILLFYIQINPGLVALSSASEGWIGHSMMMFNFWFPVYSEIFFQNELSSD